MEPKVGERPAVDLEVVIPALNEERRLPATLQNVVAYLERQPYTSAVVVVDNGSTDATAEVAVAADRSSRVAVHVLRCPVPGKGAAVRRGVVTSRARHVGFADADLATPIDTLDSIMPLLWSGVPVVIGSRRVAGARYEVPQSVGRQLGGLGFRWLTSLVVDGYADTQCGFKFFDGEVARDLFARGRTTGFAFDVELLALARASGLEVAQVPVTWSDCDGSTFRPIQDGLISAGELVQIAIRRSGRRPAAKRRVPGWVTALGSGVGALLGG